MPEKGDDCTPHHGTVFLYSAVCPYLDNERAARLCMEYPPRGIRPPYLCASSTSIRDTRPIPLYARSVGKPYTREPKRVRAFVNAVDAYSDVTCEGRKTHTCPRVARCTLQCLAHRTSSRRPSRGAGRSCAAYRRSNAGPLSSKGRRKILRQNLRPTASPSPCRLADPLTGKRHVSLWSDMPQRAHPRNLCKDPP